MVKKILFLLLFTTIVQAQNFNQTCESLYNVNQLIQKYHFKPKPVNDSLSAFVFEKMLEELDPQKNTISKEEYDILLKHKFKIDDYLNSNNCQFLQDIVNIYDFAIRRKLEILQQLKDTKLDYSGKDTLFYKKPKKQFSVKQENMNSLWNKKMRFEILNEISSQSENLDSLTQNFESIEISVKDNILNSNICKINALLEKDELQKLINDRFLNAFTNYFDPHSAYFTDDAKSSFISSLSPEKLTIGLDVTISENDELIIEDLVPGGPAIALNTLEKGDIITKVGSNKNKMYDVNCTSLDIIGEVIFSDLNKNIFLTVRKKNGSNIDVHIRKRKMKSRTSSVYSYVLGDSTRIGYIKIPSFYTDFDGRTNKGCSNDVAKEMFKLNKQKIDGIILDLEDNGGGSMREAIDLTSMFVNSGPISILQNSNGEHDIIEDNYRGQIYNGPLLILCNHGVASASEFFIGAMQDYNRAIVVGSRTAGKASMQSILPLKNSKKNNEYLKLTGEKFYRITGKSHQAIGVIPDVVLPQLNDSIAKNEKDQINYLENDQIEINLNFKPISKTKINNAVAKSLLRIKNDSTFSLYQKLNKEIFQSINDDRKPLQIKLEDAFANNHLTDDLYEKLEDLTSKKYKTTVERNYVDQEKIKLDDFDKAENELRINKIMSSPYISEAIKILTDMNFDE